MNETSPETSFETVNFLVDSFMQENKLAMMKNDEFNHGYKPKLVEIVHSLNNQTVDARFKIELRNFVKKNWLKSSNEKSILWKRWKVT